MQIYENNTILSVHEVSYENGTNNWPCEFAGM